MKLQVKNWKKYQHYKDRSPPWIKLHNCVLNDRDFMALSLGHRGLLMLIWVLASEDDGCIEADDLPFRFRLPSVDLKPLIDRGFLVVCKQMIASDTHSVSVSVSHSVSSEGDARGGFDAFWKAYPRKTGKKAAIKAWERAKDRPAIQEILKALSVQAASDQWKKDGGQYIPNPATWLNQGRWSDEPKTSAVFPADNRPAFMIREEALEHAKEKLAAVAGTMGRNSEDFRRAMSALGTQYAKLGKNRQGQTIVDEALDLLTVREQATI